MIEHQQTHPQTIHIEERDCVIADCTWLVVDFLPTFAVSCQASLTAWPSGSQYAGSTPSGDDLHPRQQVTGYTTKSRTINQDAFCVVCQGPKKTEAGSQRQE